MPSNSYRLAILLCMCLFFVYGTIQHAILLFLPFFLVPYLMYVCFVSKASLRWLKGEVITSKRAMQIEYVCAFLLSNYIFFSWAMHDKEGLIKAFVFMPCLIFGFYLSRKCVDPSDNKYSLACNIQIPFSKITKPYKIVISLVVWASIFKTFEFFNLSLSNIDLNLSPKDVRWNEVKNLFGTLYFISLIPFLMLNIAWIKNEVPKKVYMYLIRTIGIFFISIYIAWTFATFGLIIIGTLKFIIYMIAVAYIYIWHRKNEMKQEGGLTHEFSETDLKTDDLISEKHVSVELPASRPTTSNNKTVKLLVTIVMWWPMLIFLIKFPYIINSVQLGLDATQTKYLMYFVYAVLVLPYLLLAKLNSAWVNENMISSKTLKLCKIVGMIYIFGFICSTFFIGPLIKPSLFIVFIFVAFSLYLYKNQKIK